MEALEDAVVQLVRLGLTGDAPSIERFANRILRRAKGTVDDSFRRALSEVLLTHASSRAVSPRDARSTWSPADSERPRLEPVREAVPPVLSERVSAAIERLVRERTNAAALADAGIDPTRSALLVGPPGVGKTMTARHLASRLDLPLVTLDLVTVMSSLLGQSGQNIRREIDQARSTACVFFLDEVDAIAKRRDDPTDVGELKRIVNLLLLELDRWPSTSLLVAATNHPELLDRAIWRRFDLVLELDLPNEQMRRRILEAALSRHAETLSGSSLDFVVRATPGASGSELATLVRSALRETILAEKPLDELLRRDALTYLAGRAAQSKDERDLLCRLAHDELRMSHREIAALIDVSHVTVGNILKSKSPPSRRDRVKPGAGRSVQRGRERS